MQELVKKYNKICFLNPMNKLVSSQFHQSMLNFVTSMFKNGFKVSGLMTDNSVPGCRNGLVEAANDLYEEDKPDLYLWVDSDQVFTFQNFMKLLHHYDMGDGSGVLGARVLMKNAAGVPLACAYRKDSNGDYQCISSNLNGILEVDAIKLGFCLVPPEVMNGMYAAHGKKQFILTWLLDNLVDEEFYWCDLVRSLGYKIYVDNTVTVGHFNVALDENFLINFSKNN